jgi:hypothetical protein
LKHEGREGLVWNSIPGALLTLTPGFSDTLADLPFNFGTSSLLKGCDGPTLESRFSRTNTTWNNKFTAVIYTQLTSASRAVHLSAPIFKVARNVAASAYVDQVNNQLTRKQQHLKTADLQL